MTDSNNKQIALIAFGVLMVLFGLGIYIWQKDSIGPNLPIEKNFKSYSSEKYGFSFEYPSSYYLKEKTDAGTAEKPQLALVVVPDTKLNRDLLDGNITEPMEGPTAITIEAHQNTEALGVEAWIKKNTNWVASFGAPTPTTVAGTEGVAYNWDGLYAGKTIAVPYGDKIILFSVTWITTEDAILADFAELLQSVEFAKVGDAQNPPTSADGAPEGSIHNLPLPPAVKATKSLAATRAKVNENQVLILTAYEKEWSDSCLGLGGPAESCLQAITPGYEVTVMVGGEKHIFRTDATGSAIREDK